MKKSIKILASLSIAIITLLIIAMFLASALFKDYAYTKCMEEKAESFCEDQGGIKTWSPSRPHVICNGLARQDSVMNPGKMTLISIDDPLIYIFNESEIEDCWQK